MAGIQEKSMENSEPAAKKKKEESSEEQQNEPSLQSPTEQKEVSSSKDDDFYASLAKEVAWLKRRWEYDTMDLGSIFNDDSWEADQIDAAARRRMERAATRERENVVEMVRKRIEELEAKHPEQTDSYGCLGFGRFQWDIDVAALGDNFIYSPETIIDGVPFRLACRAVTDAEGKDPEISLCCDENALGREDTVIIRPDLLLTSGYSTVSYTGMDPVTLTASRPRTSLCYACKISIGLDLDREGRLSIDARLRVLSHYKKPSPDLSRFNDSPPDVTLLVRGKAFRANKKFLSDCSEFFQSLFFSDFAEKGKDTVTLKDINVKDFEEFMAFISHQGRDKVTVANVKSLLKMADFFNVDILLKDCIKYLNESTVWRASRRLPFLTVAEKLQMSEEYRLYEVIGTLLYRLKTTHDVFEAFTFSDFGQLSEPLQKIILKKYIKFYHKRPFISDDWLF